MATSRRQKGEGSMTQLPNGKYRIRIETEPVNGKRKWLTKVVATKTEAIKTLKDLERQKEDIHLIASNRPTSFLLHIGEYLKAKLAQGIQESTYITYEKTLTLIGNSLGQVPLVKLTTNHFDDLVVTWRKEGLSERTIRTRINVAFNMLDWCVYKGYIATNLLSYHKKTQKQIGAVKDKKVEVLSSKEHTALKEASLSVWNDFLRSPNFLLYYMFYPCYLLAYETGMRVGEIAALKWEDINFETNTVSIHATRKISIKGRETEGKPKYSSFRDIVISKETCEVLKTLKDTYKVTSEYVFTSYRSKWEALSTDTFRDVFKNYRDKIGMTRPFTFHGIRHTNASLMIHAGIPVTVVSERLGHSSVAVTYKTYAHIIDDCKERKQAVVKA